MIALILVAVVVVGITSLIAYARWNFGTLEAMSIQVVEGRHFLMGSTYDSHSVVNGIRDIEWMKKYGPVFGVYEGRQPQIHINDASLIRQILVKDYQFFNRRREQDFGSALLNEQLDFLPVAKWKVVRRFLTPQFSSTRIKAMNLAMNECMSEFIKNLHARTNTLTGPSSQGILDHFDIRQESFNLVTDTILRCVFSIKVHDQSNNQFLQILNKLLGVGEQDLGVSGAYSFTASLALSFPFLRKFLSRPLFDQAAANEFVRTFKEITEKRRELQMPDAQGKTSSGGGGDFIDSVLSIMENLDSPEFKEVQVTEITILCQVLVFFFAAQDPISTTITALTYHIASDPDIEQRVVQEVDKFFQGKTAALVDHDSLMTDLPYLNACIKEALRLYPYFIRIERVCTADWESEAGVEGSPDVKIPKGTIILIPTWAANRNPDSFERPEEFDPCRFISNEHEQLPSSSRSPPYAFTSFGHGPRNCIGQRFAMETLAVFMAHMLQNFKIELRSVSALQGLKWEAGSLIAAVVKPIYLTLKSRRMDN